MSYLSVRLMLTVEDPEAKFRRAVEAGAKIVRPI